MANQLAIILLFVVGTGLAVAEIFLPGAIVGIVGLVCIVGAIAWAFTVSSALGWTLVVITLVSLPFYIVVWLKMLNRLFSMNFTQEGYTSAEEGLESLLGQEGISVTQLRPAGMARFGERKVDVVSQSEVIDAGTRVTVVDVTSNRVVVRAVRG